MLAAQIGSGNPGPVLFQNADDLIFGKPAALHLWSSRLVQSLTQTGLGAGGNANRLSATVGSPEQAAKLKRIVDDVAEITGKARIATGDAQAILSHVKKGRGSVGALVMDEQVYDDLQEMVRDLKHNPWKFFWRE